MSTVSHTPETPAAVQRMTRCTDAGYPFEPRYTVTRVESAHADDTAPRPRTVTGYGVLPTRYRVTLKDGRTRRVYVDNYGNGGGTPWVRIAGVQCYLSPETVAQLDALTPA